MSQEISMIAVQSHLEVRDIGEVTVITFADKIIEGRDDSLVNQIKEELFEAAKTAKKRVLLNLADVERMEDLMAGALFSFKFRKLSPDSRLAICNVNEDIFEVLDKLKFVKVLGVLENTDQEAALAILDQ